MSAYVIFDVEIFDLARYQEFMAGVKPALEAAGGKYLVRGGECTQLEGVSQGDRRVVIEFPSRQAAEAWYNSPEYQAILPHRKANSEGHIALMDGFEG